MKSIKSVRWNIESAAREFGINPRTLSARIRKEGLLPGKDKLFSTADICRAVFGDMEVERLRKTREEADKLALENDKTRGALVEADKVYKWAEGVFVALRQGILASGLNETEKDELLGELRGLKDRGAAKLAGS